LCKKMSEKGKESIKPTKVVSASGADEGTKKQTTKEPNLGTTKKSRRRNSTGADPRRKGDRLARSKNKKRMSKMGRVEIKRKYVEDRQQRAYEAKALEGDRN